MMDIVILELRNMEVFFFVDKDFIYYLLVFN